jgi:lysophospholipase L1-like esterase
VKAAGARFSPLAGRLIVLLCSAVFVLSMTELLARFDVFGGEVMFLDMVRISWDSKLRFTLKPNAKSRGLFFKKHVLAMEGGKLQQRAEFDWGYYTTNSQGFRGREFGAGELRDRKVVLCLGDSTTFGMFVEADEAYPAVLESFLRQRGWTDVLVVNAGVNGYDLSQYDASLKALLRRFKPDVVTVGLCMNDYAPPAFGWTREVLGYHLRASAMVFRQLEALSRRLGWVGHPAVGAGKVCRDLDSGTIRSIADLAVKTGSPAQQLVAEQDLYYNPALWTEALKLLETMKARCDREGIRFLCAVFPTQVQVRPGFSYPEPQRTIARFLSGAGIDFIDMTPLFRSSTLGGRFCFPFFTDPFHFNARAHSLIAESLAERLRPRSLPARRQ